LQGFGVSFYVAMTRLWTLICAWALAAAVCPVGASAADPPSDPAWLFDPNSVVEIDLTLPPASRDALDADPNEYQPGTFALSTGGESYGPLDVGIRLKGGIGSFRTLDGKAAFKVKFDELVDDQTFSSLEKLTLNNMVQDSSMIHETLAYESFRAAGVAAPRTGYAFVRVNGVAYGLYLNVETLDSIALPRWFASTGHLYEGSYGVDVEPADLGEFEVDEGKSKDRKDLETLIAAASNGDGDWSDGMDAVADLTQMTRMWAVERYIGHWDGYSGYDVWLGTVTGSSPNNYYLHSERNETVNPVFRMLPWGTDQTWEDRLRFDGAGGLMFNKCLADASCAALYRDGLRQARSSISALNLDARAVELATLLAPWQSQDPRHGRSPQEVAAAVAAARAFIAKRPGDLDAWLPAAPSSLEGGEPATARKRRSLRIGTPRASGSVVTTRLYLPEAGRAVQRVMAEVDGRKRTLCTGGSRRARAGSLTLRCRLSSLIRRRLAEGLLAPFARISFTPADGKHVSVLRQVVVAKQPRA
jgi:CotH kinase protein